MSRKLLVMNPEHCMEVQFDQQITIGRDVYNSLSLQDAEISRSHAIIFEQDNEVIVKDLKSRNGVYVQGQRVQESALKPDDEIIMGSTVIIFDPTEALDLERALSKRGRFLLEKRPGKAVTIEEPQEPTVFECADMRIAVDRLFNEPEATSFFTMRNAMMLLQAFKEMSDAADSSALLEIALRRAISMLGGHHGVIMETDERKAHLKVRSIHSTDNSETILIGQDILKILLGGEKCLFSPNVAKDKRFEKMARKRENAVYSFVAAPILSGEELFGFIYLDSQDKSIAYDYNGLRSLYMIAAQIGSLLRPRPTHFDKHAPSTKTPVPALGSR
jgi:pSer/pThr/pTyr-binding forkhead associated (FHA) protein